MTSSTITTGPPARFWHRESEDPNTDRIVCDLCPRRCHLREGQRAFCFVRQNIGGEMVLTTYGKSTGFCIDPIEKKPLNHFYPGTSVLSFGTAGCNLGCRFCQNWDISKARQVDILTQKALPETIAKSALDNHCRSVAFTYNDPVIFAEYAIDTAKACHEVGVATVAVTAGYITKEARAAFFEPIDAANVDLKAFSERFYRKLCLAELGPVLDTLAWLHAETNVWLEVTTLLIPGENDSDDEIARLCDWFTQNLGTETPLHFTAFHPDFELRDHPRTSVATLHRARDIARAAGLKHIYTGNVHDPDGQSTFCASCGQRVIARDGYTIGAYDLDAHSACLSCGAPLAGHFGETKGAWGSRRQRVRPKRI
ncbi:MAG: AmmeMemoRadiSam system radical SAM enzyme [Deltaproteobacteria bacterium]|nr:AmmeMemoRadiSam system radical SAM enzyme [Deltaproteobacteria bacterium]